MGATVQRPLSSAGGWSRLIAAWPWLAVVLLVYLTWPTQSLWPSVGLDPSWQAGLHLLAHGGVSFGSVVYTYGPLGFLSVPVFYFTWTAVLSLAYLAVGKAVLAAALLRSTRLSFPGWLAVLLAFLALALPGNDFLILAVFLWCVRVLEEPAAFAGKQWLVPTAGALSALQLLVKLNYGATSLAITAIAVWWLRPFRWKAEALLAGSFLVTFIVLWAAERNSFEALPLWIHEAFDVAVGISAGVAIEEPGREWEYFAAAVILAAITHLLWRHSAGVERRRRTSLFAVYGLFCFSFFKEGFVRHDAHSALFFGACAVACLALAWRSPLRWAAVATLAATAIAGGAASDWRRPFLYLNPVESVQRMADSAGAADNGLKATFNPRWRRNELAAARTAMRKSLAVDPRMLRDLEGRTVLIDPYEITTAWVYGFRWRPLPTLQTWLGYTPFLDGQNARLLSSRNAPDRILRQSGPGRLDFKTPEIESPAYFLAILCHYKQARADGQWQLLVRTVNRCRPPRLIRSVDAGPDELVTVPTSPKAGTLVFARIHLQKSFFDLRSVLLKPARTPLITINEGGVYHLLSGTAADPIVMRVPAATGFSPLYGGGLATNTFSVHDVRSRFRVDFYSVPYEGFSARLRPGGHEIELGGGTIPVAGGAVQGRVDGAEASGGIIHFIGWSASTSRSRPADEVLVFSHGRLVYSAISSGDRPDVAAFYRNDALRSSGFAFDLPLALVVGGMPDVRVFGVVDGRASELEYYTDYAWKTPASGSRTG
jgi:hypothetical protein